MRVAPRRGQACGARASGAALLIALGSLSAVSIGSAAGTNAVGAHAARALAVTDSARLYLVSADGNTLVERGRASGTLPGTVEVSLTLGDRTATSNFTIHTKGGTISGRGKGKLKAGKAGYDSFGGSVAVVGGSGRFRGARGKGGLYGSIYRVNDAMSVQVTGMLRY